MAGGVKSFSLFLVLSVLAPGGVAGKCTDGRKECDWYPWATWGGCSETCGVNGRQTRDRGICCNTSMTYGACVKKCGVKYEDGQETRSCGQICNNGGVFVTDSCQCINGFSGNCCEKEGTTTVLTTTTTPTPTTTERLCQTPFWKTGIISAANLEPSSNAVGKVPEQAYSNCNIHPCGWCPDPNKVIQTQYFQVSLNKPWVIQAIEIRPPAGERPNTVIRNYMTNYTFQYQPVGGSKFITYGTEQAGPIYQLGVQGNRVSLTSTLTEINRPITQRFRIAIVDSENHACFRFEIFGCESLCDCENGGSCIAKGMCLCPPPFYGPRCHYIHLPELGGCLKPLGMWNSEIKNQHLVVSSSADRHGKEKARYICCAGEKNGAWCPATNDSAPFYEVRFPKPVMVAMLMFQQPNVEQYWELPTSYMMTFNLEYHNMETDAIETWSSDVDAIASATISYSPILDPYLFTDVIRILPKTWTNQPCFRMEIIGCDTDDGPIGISYPILGRKRRNIIRKMNMNN